MTIREALTRSINTIAFQTFKKMGSETALSYLDKMKFSSLSYADNTAPAISLGGFTNGVTINNMCRGYATIANNGQMSSRTCLVKVDHETKGNIYTAPELDDSQTQVFSSDTAFIMQDLLQGRLQKDLEPDTELITVIRSTPVKQERPTVIRMPGSVDLVHIIQLLCG